MANTRLVDRVGTASGTLAILLLAVGLAFLVYYVRVFPLGVQDRVIRLEERLRLQRLCPDLGPRLERLTRGQLIALRFASDAELPELSRKVLADQVRDRTAIKKMIRNWTPDYHRV